MTDEASLDGSLESIQIQRSADSDVQTNHLNRSMQEVVVGAETVENNR